MSKISACISFFFSGIWIRQRFLLWFPHNHLMVIHLFKATNFGTASWICSSYLQLFVLVFPWLFSPGLSQRRAMTGLVILSSRSGMKWSIRTLKYCSWASPKWADEQLQSVGQPASPLGPSPGWKRSNQKPSVVVEPPL